MAPDAIAPGEDTGPLPYSGSDAQGDHILATHCPACGYFNFPPSRVCAHCMSVEVQAKALSRRGVLYSHSTMRRGDRTFHVGYVDLPEQIRVLGVIEGFEGAPRCDTPVELARVKPITEPNPQREPVFVFRRAD